MSEALLESPPQHELIEAHGTPEKPTQAERTGSMHHEKHEDNPSDRLSEIRSSIQEVSTSSRETKQATMAPKVRSNSPLYVDKKMKADSLKQELAVVRKQLPKSEQALSRVVHNKAVQKVSDVGEKTVARPQALLFGGFFAVVASGGLYFTAKYIGFQYNYLVSIMCFVGGYFVGLIAELVLRVVRPTHKQA